MKREVVEPGTGGADEVLQLLLPDASEATRHGATRIVMLARLAAEDARAPRAQSTGVTVDHARDELDAVLRRELRDALDALLGNVLLAQLGGESFAEWAPPVLGWQAAWSVLEQRRALEAVPDVPRPGAAVSDLVDRLLAYGCPERGAGEEPGRGTGRGSPPCSALPSDALPSDDWCAVWRARRAWAFEGPRAGATAFERLLVERSSSLAWEDELACIAGVAQCLLDRGAVAAAGEWLERHMGRVSCDPRLIRLLGWVHVLAGRHAAAAELLDPAHDADAPELRLPAALDELRASGVAGGDLLRGAPAPDAREPRPLEARGEAGAVLLAVLVLARDGTSRCVHADVAPALRARADEHFRSRETCARRVGEPEHELLTTADPVIVRAVGEAAPRGAASPRGRALALVPIADEHGEVAGWLHLEWEHQLVPTQRRLCSAARQWRERVRQELRTPKSVATPSMAAQDPRGRVVERWLMGSGRKWNSRRWWVFDTARGDPRCVGTGGGALDDWRERVGHGRALERARIARGPVAFQAGDPALAIHADAASGVVAPITFDGSSSGGATSTGEVWGLVAIEGTRRGDFRGSEARRVTAEARRVALEFRAAQFRAWHLRRFGYDVHLDLRDLSESSPSVLLSLARSPAPVALSGAPGTGKEIVARWLHFEGTRGAAPAELDPDSAGSSCPSEHPGSAPGPGADLCHYVCGVRDPGAEERLLFGAGGGPGGIALGAGARTVVLEGVERLAPAAQVRLARLLEREHGAGSATQRLVVLSTQSPAELGERGVLQRELAAPLGRLHVPLLPLRRRRAAILPLFQALLVRFAARERTPAPSLSDAAAALLWRQRWERNARDLEVLAQRLILAGTLEVDPEDLLEVAAPLTLVLERRMPSRRPDPADLRAALTHTRHRTGAFNKRRAALYLGWDPDTLVARMRDLGVTSATLFE